MTVDLAWQGDLRFEARSKGIETIVDGDGAAGPSPVQALAIGLAGCMATDVVQILTKGRLPLEGLTARLRGERAPEDPRRFVRIDLHFAVRGDIPPDRVERAIDLSRDRYCAVWHSLRPDIDFRTSFEVCS